MFHLTPVVLRSALTLTAAVALMLLSAACGDSPTEPTPNVSFQTIDLQVGAGAEATSGRVVEVHYTGWLYSTGGTDNKGTQFDSSAGRAPLRFTLGTQQVIAGFSQGVTGMRVGGRRRIVIPPSLGYGAAGLGPVPPNAALVFDVELVTVE